MHSLRTNAVLMFSILSSMACSDKEAEPGSEPASPWATNPETRPAFLLVEIDEFTDNTDSWSEYQASAGATLAAHQVNGLMASDDATRFEGDSPDAWIVGLQFSEVATTLTWYNDPDYERARPLRFEAVNTTNMAVFRGLPGSDEIDYSEFESYLLITVESIEDEDGFSRYQTTTKKTLEKHGGTALVAGKPEKTLEGSWHEDFTLYVAFPSASRLAAWYSDPIQTAARNERDQISTGVSVLGLPAFRPPAP